MSAATDHNTPAQIATAAKWLVKHWDTAPQPLTRTLRQRQQFGLNFGDSVKTIAEARRLREVADELS